MQIFEAHRKKEMHIFKAFIKPCCTVLKRSCKGEAFFMTFIYHDAKFWETHKKEMRILKGLHKKPWCALLRFSCKGDAFFRTFINRAAHFRNTHKKGMQFLKTFIKWWCTFLRRAYKGYAIFNDLYKIVVRIFEARTVGINVHEGKYIKIVCRM